MRVSEVQIRSAPAARPVFAPLSRAPSEIPAFTESFMANKRAFTPIVCQSLPSPRYSSITNLA
jgi:hypothetical protein